MVFFRILFLRLENAIQEFHIFLFRKKFLFKRIQGDLFPRLRELSVFQYCSKIVVYIVYYTSQWNFCCDCSSVTVMVHVMWLHHYCTRTHISRAKSLDVYMYVYSVILDVIKSFSTGPETFIIMICFSKMRLMI